jgi:2'-5' RNA ligase
VIRRGRAGETDVAPNLRLFVALDPPEAVRRRLAAVQASLRTAAGRHAEDVRWVAPSRLHLTLHFLGSVPEERVGAIGAAVLEEAALSRPIRLEIRGAGGFPTARRPRVVWAGVAGDLEALGALAAALGRRLTLLGLPADGRPFAPHLTLGRSREARGAAGLGGAIAAAAEGDPVAWRAEEVVLFRSHLDPGGARHEPLLSAPLGPG